MPADAQTSYIIKSSSDINHDEFILGNMWQDGIQEHVWDV